MTAYRPASGIAVEQREDAVYIARLPDGPIIALHGTAAIIWIEACTAAVDSIADRVASRVARGADEISADVDAFIRNLVAQGLLVPGGRSSI